MINPELIHAYNALRDTDTTHLICHAPYSSLNFEQNGNVTTCCYNRTYVLGKYPKSSLQEIWAGDRLNKLREYIKANDLTHGCQLCLAQLGSGNFAGTRAKGFDHFAQPPDFDEGKVMPKVLEFEISNTCNLECTMCYGHFSSSILKNREQKPAQHNPYNKAFVEQLTPFIPHLKAAKFLGGEPFLIDRYYEIWDKMIEINPDILIEITTNGTVLNEKVKRTLENLRTNLIISIDSVNKDTYELIRKNANFDRVMNHIDYFREYTQRKGTELFFAVCPIRKNWREMPEIVQYCNERNIRVHFNTVITPIAQSLFSMTHIELDEVKSYYQSIDLPNDSNIEKLNYAAFNGLFNQIEEWQKKAYAVYAKAPSPIEALRMHPNDVPDEQQLKDFVPLLLQYMLELYFIRSENEPLFPVSDHYEEVYEKGLELYLAKVNLLLDHYPYADDLKTYMTAIRNFYLTIEPDADEATRNLMLNKIDKVFEAIDFMEDLEKMYIEFTKIDPQALLQHINAAGIEGTIPYLLNEFS